MNVIKEIDKMLKEIDEDMLFQVRMLETTQKAIMNDLIMEKEMLLDKRKEVVDSLVDSLVSKIMDIINDNIFWDDGQKIYCMIDDKNDEELFGKIKAKVLEVFGNGF